MSASAKLLKASGPVYSQDRGRWGFQHLGIGSGGASDKFAQSWANKLLLNSPESSTLEIFLGNCAFSFSHAARVAITGADCHTTLNGQPINNWVAFNVKAGDELKFSMPSSGLYSYLAIIGGFHIEPVMGSTSISSREKIGPNNGSAFQEGAIFFYSENEIAQTHKQSLHWSLIPDYAAPVALRVIPSKHSSASRFNWHELTKQTFSIQADSNKMGVRLTGSKVNLARTKTYSEAIVEGCVQIPPNGDPIILMSEHQTIGGYPILGCIYTVDIPLLAQRRPGQTVQLSKGSIDEACDLLQKQQALLR